MEQFVERVLSIGCHATTPRHRGSPNLEEQSRYWQCENVLVSLRTSSRTNHAHDGVSLLVSGTLCSLFAHHR